MLLLKALLIQIPCWQKKKFMPERMIAKKEKTLNRNSIFELNENVENHQQKSFVSQIKIFLKNLFQKE